MANHFVKVGGTGNGSTWALAWAPQNVDWSVLAAGDTVWISGGNYSSGLSTAAKNGTSGNPISFKRALASDPIGTGFPGFPGESQIIMPAEGIDCSFSANNIVFDGRTHTETFSGSVSCGWQINIAANGGAGVSVGHGTGGGGQTMANISFINIATIGPQPTPVNSSGTSTGSMQGFQMAGSNSSYSNILISHCVNRGTNELFRGFGWNRVIIEYTFISDSLFTSGDHDDIIYCYPPNSTTWRYNTVCNSFADGWFAEYTGNMHGWYFYGNTVYNFDGAHVIVMKGPDAGVMGTCGPVYIYNNTFVNNTGELHWDGSTLLGNCFIRNNIFWSTQNSMGPGSGDYVLGSGVSNPVSSNNAYNGSIPAGDVGSITLSTSPFVTIPATGGIPGRNIQPWGTAGDLHLTTAGKAALLHGFSNPLNPDAQTGINVDQDGNTRGGTSGTWMIGAYDVAGGGVFTVAPNPPTSIAATSSGQAAKTLLVSWIAPVEGATQAPPSNLAYRIERETGATANWVQITETAVAPSPLQFLDTGQVGGPLGDSTTYGYRMRSDDVGDALAGTVYSNTGSGTTLAPDTSQPTAPGSLTLNTITSSSMTATWTVATDINVASNLLIYTLQRGLNSTTFATVASGVNLLSFPNTGLNPLTQYFFQVFATNPNDSLSGPVFPSPPAVEQATTLATPTTPVLVQSVTSANYVGSATATTGTAVYTAQNSGDLNIVTVSYGSLTLATPTQTIVSVTDSNHNPYSVARPFLSFSAVGGGSLGQAIYYSNNIVAGANTVTVTLSAAANFVAVGAYEYVGISDATPLDVTAAATGTATAASSGAATTSLTNDLVFGSISSWDGVTAVGTGYTQLANFNGGVDFSEARVNPTASSIAVTVTDGGTSGWVAQMATFKASPTAPVSNFVQSSSSQFSGSPSAQVAFSSAQTVGNDNFVVVSTTNPTSTPVTISSVTDQAGNVYSLVDGPTSIAVGSNTISQSIYVAGI